MPLRFVAPHAARSLFLVAIALAGAGCASLQEVGQTPHAAHFPAAPGRTYYLKKSPFGSTILVCDAGPSDTVCFEKPH